MLGDIGSLHFQEVGSQKNVLTMAKSDNFQRPSAADKSLLVFFIARLTVENDKDRYTEIHFIPFRKSTAHQSLRHPKQNRIHQGEFCRRLGAANISRCSRTQKKSFVVHEMESSDFSNDERSDSCVQMIGCISSV